MAVAVTAVTHPGLQRTTNQDRIVVGRSLLGSGSTEPVDVVVPDFALLAIIDGMGGAAGGELAAGLAADVLASTEACENEDRVETVLVAANARLYDGMAQVPALAGMGATVAGACVGPHEALVFNVGDARVYVEVDGELVQASIDDGSPTRPGAVTASLGGLAQFAPIEPHVFREVSLRRRFFVMSDGISGVVDHASLEHACVGHDDAAAAGRLVAAALAVGAPDNLSLVIARPVEVMA